MNFCRQFWVGCLMDVVVSGHRSHHKAMLVANLVFWIQAVFSFEIARQKTSSGFNTVLSVETANLRILWLRWRTVERTWFRSGTASVGIETLDGLCKRIDCRLQISNTWRFGWNLINFRCVNCFHLIVGGFGCLIDCRRSEHCNYCLGCLWQTFESKIA